MQALNICSILKIASYSLPVLGAKLINQLLELLVFFLLPPSFLNVELVKGAISQAKVIGVIYNPINKIFILSRTLRIFLLVDITLAEVLDSQIVQFLIVIL